jgi:hypothetical protein
MIVGFVGKKGSGKTTAADALVAEHGFRKHNFKDTLIAEIKHKMPAVLHELVNVYEKIDYDGMNPWTVERLFKEKPPLMRALLQNYGTEVRRADDPMYWVDAWGQLASALSEQDIVVDDVRFENEAQAVRDMGGVLIRVMKDSFDYPIVDAHASETEQDSIVVNHEIKVKEGEVNKLKELVFKAVFVD